MILNYDHHPYVFYVNVFQFCICCVFLQIFFECGDSNTTLRITIFDTSDIHFITDSHTILLFAQVANVIASMIGKCQICLETFIAKIVFAEKTRH